jgi:hypothetical protein
MNLRRKNKFWDCQIKIERDSKEMKFSFVCLSNLSSTFLRISYLLGFFPDKDVGWTAHFFCVVGSKK